MNAAYLKRDRCLRGEGGRGVPSEWTDWTQWTQNLKNEISNPEREERGYCPSILSAPPTRSPHSSSRRWPESKLYGEQFYCSTDGYMPRRSPACRGAFISMRSSLVRTTAHGVYLPCKLHKRHANDMNGCQWLLWLLRLIFHLIKCKKRKEKVELKKQKTKNPETETNEKHLRGKIKLGRYHFTQMQSFHALRTFFFFFQLQNKERFGATGWSQHWPTFWTLDWTNLLTGTNLKRNFLKVGIKEAKSDSHTVYGQEPAHISSSRLPQPSAFSSAQLSSAA